MKKEEKPLTVYGGLMSTEPDNADISLVSSIIQDGIKNYTELTKKFAACKRLSYEEASERIKEMKREGKIGYYHSTYSTYYETVIYYFTRWSPENIVFPAKGLYKSDREKYFNPLFREASLKKNLA